jgi:hypothetical protein
MKPCGLVRIHKLSNADRSGVSVFHSDYETETPETLLKRLFWKFWSANIMGRNGRREKHTGKKLGDKRLFCLKREYREIRPIISDALNNHPHCSNAIG